jgi:hypothetical protein
MTRKPKGNKTWMSRGVWLAEPAATDPTRFDQLLQRLGVAESEAGSHPVARAWVRIHYRNCYVPETVLAQAGVREVVV